MIRCKLILLLFVVLLTSCNKDGRQSLIESSYHSLEIRKVPLFEGRYNKDILNARIVVHEDLNSITLQKVEIILQENGDTGFIDEIKIENSQSFVGKALIKENVMTIRGEMLLYPDTNDLCLSFKIREGARLDGSFSISKVKLYFDHNACLEMMPREHFTYRPAKVLRSAGQDNCDTYRIPGLVTTNDGTLIAVYDNRYKSSKDLQGDIDVGMSRSTDGGQSWEPMRVIMDMGKWGGHSEDRNGIGDPCVLYDHKRGIIWVAALWMSGIQPDKALWWASSPGMSPVETGQFMLVKSTDDGLTWSDPVNITGQVRDPEWQLLLQGPGRGICLDDGTLVFPAQFKADRGEKALDGGKYTSHSTIVYSTDGGSTWNTGTGAKPNTTEAQVVQLSDGSLMLNMRDDRNRIVKDETNGRAVAVTNDLGLTWTTHPTSNSALPEPNCMASLIAADIDHGSHSGRVLFFSNPDDKYKRTNMTIKASLDEGATWPEEYHLELNEEEGFGYSCLSMIDKETIGILYEGVKELYFQLIKVDELLGNS